MKNLYSKNEFLSAYKEESEMINEGLFDFIGKMFNKIKGYINSVNGGKEIDAIYNKYKNLIQADIKKSTGIDLNLNADKNVKNTTTQTTTSKPGVTTQTTTAKPGVTQTTTVPPAGTTQTTTAPPANASFNYTDGEKLNEADAAAQSAAPAAAQPEQANADPKSVVKLLKQKENLIMTILKKYQDKAAIEMNKILVKYGGAEKTPKLATIINNQKEQLRLDILSAEIAVIQQSGDKTYAAMKNAELTKLAKAQNASWDSLKSGKQPDVVINGIKYKVGVPYRYNGDNGLKVIRIIKASKDPAKVIAADMFGKKKDFEQPFTVDKIDTKFAPVNGTEYNYFSKDRNKIIKVKTIEEPKNGKVKVQGEGTPFFVNVGSLMDIKAKEQKVKKEENTGNTTTDTTTVNTGNTTTDTTTVKTP